jgi:hypothetical protein
MQRESFITLTTGVNVTVFCVKGIVGGRTSHRHKKTFKQARLMFIQKLYLLVTLTIYFGEKHP